METLLEKLLELLSGEITLYGEMVRVLQNEKDAIIDSDLGEVERITREKENLAIKLRIVEEQRGRMIARLSGSLEPLPEQATLLHIARLVDEPYATKLEACQSNFASLMQSIAELNRANSELLAHSLDLVRGSLLFLDNLGNVNSVYRENGHLGNRSRSGKFLSGRA